MVLKSCKYNLGSGSLLLHKLHSQSLYTWHQSVNVWPQHTATHLAFKPNATQLVCGCLYGAQWWKTTSCESRVTWVHLQVYNGLWPKAHQLFYVRIKVLLWPSQSSDFCWTQMLRWDLKRCAGLSVIRKWCKEERRMSQKSFAIMIWRRIPLFLCFC